jgi:hypothetical protein
LWHGKIVFKTTVQALFAITSRPAADSKTLLSVRDQKVIFREILVT